jgi:hypothetical protein
VEIRCFLCESSTNPETVNLDSQKRFPFTFDMFKYYR